MYNNQWTFFQVPGQKALASEDVRYWKNNLFKILKAGLEFEFNLPNRKGSCKGTSHLCPCIHLKVKDCWSVCLNTENCKKEFGDAFDAKCAKQMCSGFSMACAECNDFQLDCETCEHRYDPDSDPNIIREKLREKLEPSHHYGRISKTGVHDIVTDGSLLGGDGKEKGAEVITTGRRVDYWEFYKMISQIINESMDRGAYMDERCSIHIHLLASYYDNVSGPLKGVEASMSELERPLPQIILSNFHQLCRRYQNAITWMSCGLNEKQHLTRWEKFRVSILDTSPVHMSMQEIIQVMTERSNKKRGKYGWVNYMFTEFDGNNDLTKFHVEMRSLDGILVPSAVTAMTCLFYSLFIKAIEISRYGLLEVGNKEWMAQSQNIKDRLMNGMGGWDSYRVSDNSMLTNDDIDVMTFECTDLINQLKHILLRFDPAYDVLEKLAYKPVAVRRCDGDSWKDIEEQLKIEMPEETKIEKALAELIDVRRFTKCESEEDWTIKVVAAVVEETEGEGNPDNVKEVIRNNKNGGEYLWSDNLGTMLKV